MDSCCYNSFQKVIAGVRGGRAFLFDRASGAITLSKDFQQLGLGASTIVWDSATNLYFASCWNTGQWDFSQFGSVRHFFRLTTALAVSVDFPFGSTLGVDAFALNDTPACGLSVMKNIGGTIYALGWSAKDQAAYVFQFPATATAAPNASRVIGGWGYPSIAYANVGGNNLAFFALAEAGQVVSWDFTGSVGNTSPVDGTKGYVAIEYAPAPVNRLYVTRQLRYIDIYDTALNPTGTLDTGVSDFQPVNILRNPNDGLLYVAGGQNGNVMVLNPATNTWTMKPGFDLPWNFVFVDAGDGGQKWCVQQGATPLKLIT